MAPWQLDDYSQEVYEDLLLKVILLGSLIFLGTTRIRKALITAPRLIAISFISGLITHRRDTSHNSHSRNGPLELCNISVCHKTVSS